MSFVFGLKPELQEEACSNVPRGIQSKQELMEALCSALRLPEYFGSNWDALEECVRDLTWMPSSPVVLVHEDLPLANDRAALRTYLSILRDAVAKWEKSSERRFIVVFPAAVESQVRDAMEGC